MPAKKKISFKKKEKVEAPIMEEENAVSTVVEEEIKVEEIIEPKKSSDEVIGTIWDAKVSKPKGRIKFEAQVAPYPMFKLPADIRQYLINHWLTTDVYKKDKEWLEKHKVDMKMVEKLKQFLTEVL